MNIPGYDAWRLAGPDEDNRSCPDCNDTGEKICPNCGDPPDDMNDCPECSGTGVVPCDCDNDEYPDEPDGDYEFERRRDAAMED